MKKGDPVISAIIYEDCGVEWSRPELGEDNKMVLSGYHD
jgi:hypothetical protein